MFGASVSLIDALRYGAQLVTARATVYVNGVPTEFEVPLSTASFTVDRNAAQRRTGQMTYVLPSTIPPDTLMPTNPTSLTAPFGNEVYVETGIGTANHPGTGVVEVVQWVPMGTFAIATTTVEDTVEDLTVTLTLYDRSWVIAQRLLLQPYNFPATSSGNFVDEMVALLNQVWAEDPNAPALQYNIEPTSATVPVASYNQGSDPWQACLDMASAVGYELFFNVNGVVTGYPIPDPTTQPVVWNFTDDQQAIFGAGGAGSGGGSSVLLGSPYSTPAAVTNTMTRDGIYNDVVVTGTGTGNYVQSNTGTSQPVLAQAQDTNPQSPTYINGGMGNIPQFVSSNLPVSQPQAQDMANNDLQAALSSAWQVTLQIAPNPIYDIDDVVSVTRPRVGLNNVKMVIDSLQYDVAFGDLCGLTGRVVPT